MPDQFLVYLPDFSSSGSRRYVVDDGNEFLEIDRFGQNARNAGIDIRCIFGIGSYGFSFHGFSTG
jgi:hypothetical protein